MALSFTNSTDKVNVGSAAGLDNLTTGTQAAWVRLNQVASASSERILQKGLFASGYRILAANYTVAGSFAFEAARATVALEMESGSGLLSANTWYFIAAVFNSAGADTDQKLYYATLAGALAEVGSYTTQTVGSGAFGDNSATDQIIGNKSNDGTPTNGRVAWAGIWNTALTLNQLAILKRDTSRNLFSGCQLFMHLGLGGANAVDWSGNANNGTVTGATQADHAPIQVWHIPRTWLVKPAAAASTVPWPVVSDTFSPVFGGQVVR